MSYFNGKIKLTEKQLYDYAIDKGTQVGSGTIDAHYLKYYKKHQKTGKLISWNWAAFFFSSNWLAYRKMYSIFILHLIFLAVLEAYSQYSGVKVFVEDSYFINSFFIAIALVFANMLFFGLLGDYLYFKHREIMSSSGAPFQEKRWRGLKILPKLIVITLVQVFITSMVSLIIVPNYSKFNQAIDRHTEKKYDEALTSFKHLAYQEDFAPAQIMLANLLVIGNGVEKDISEAKKLLIRPADKGMPMAMLLLAIAYLDDRQDTENLQKA